MKPAFSHLFKICLGTFSFICATSEISFAQVTPDNTVNTQVNQNGGIAEITGGEVRGSNLFHSFESFSVPTNNEAFFNNLDSIGNIFSRVTGGSVSDLDGAIRANGGANLFLINPAGIIFRENASLNIGGSFYASTADSIIFPDGEFSAIAPESESVLTVDVPIGLGFGSNPGDIINSSVANDERGLEVSVGENITLAGGNVNLSGGKIFAPGGKVELGGLSAEGKIGINNDSSLNFPEEVAKGNVSLANAAKVNVRSERNGDIIINARNFDLSGGELGNSALSAGISIDSNSSEAQAGDIIINTTDNIKVSQGSSISNIVEPEGIGNAGNINIVTSSLSLAEGSLISIGTFGRGNSGTLSINALDVISIQGEDEAGLNSGIFSQVGESARGNAGGIAITTANLSLIDGGNIEANSFGQGSGGTIEINALDTILIQGGTTDSSFKSGIFSQVASKGVGNSSGIEINTGNLSLIDGGAVRANTGGKGNAGKIEIKASDTISVTGEAQDGIPSSISSQVNEGGEGNSDGINLTTTNLSLTKGGIITASTFGKGDSGAIVINASDTIFIEGETQAGISSRINSAIGKDGAGDSNGIDITTANLTLTQGGNVNANTSGQGNAGKVKINASNTILAEGESQSGISSEISSQVNSTGVGNSDGIDIITTNLLLRKGGAVNSSSFEQGNAGKIMIDASGTIFAEGESRTGNDTSGIASLVEKSGVGGAGAITINTNDLFLADKAGISVQSLGQGNAANLIIRANSLTLEGGAFLVSSTPLREGGNISLKIANNLSLSQSSTISAQAFRDADGGNLFIDAKFITATPNQNNDLIASAEQGRGGNINIVSAGVFGLEERSSNSPNNTNDIDASSELGIDGSVNVNTTVDFLNSFELAIPKFVVAEKALQGSCFARRNSQQGSFVYSGTGGLPASPDLSIDEEPSLSSGLPETRPNSQTSNSSDADSAETTSHSAPVPQKWQVGDPIVEPTNLVKTADGRSLWVNQKASRDSLICQ